MLRLLLALALLGACGAWTPQPLLHAPPRPASRGAASSIAMKKRQGARMPGKAMQRPPTENVALKRKMKEIVALAKAAGLICPDGVRFSENERIFKDRGQVDEFKAAYVRKGDDPVTYDMFRSEEHVDQATLFNI